MGLEFAERIGHFDGSFRGGEAALDQRVGHAFVPAAGGKGAAQAQQAIMGAVGIGLGMQAGDDAGGNAVESVEPRDFLDEIDFAGEIVAEGRRLPDGFVVVLRRRAFRSRARIRFCSTVSKGISMPSRLVDPLARGA